MSESFTDNQIAEDFQRLDHLDSKFAEMAEKVKSIDSSIDIRQPSSLVFARNNLDAIISSLESLNAIRVTRDSTSSENNERSIAHNALVDDIGELLAQSKILRNQLDQSITESSPKVKREILQDDDELCQEEIAKLLLLVSRAYSIQKISSKQRGFLKDEICKRRGYLRDILLEDDISKLISNLSDISLKAEQSDP